MTDTAKQAESLAAIRRVVPAGAVIDDHRTLARFGSPGAPPAAVVMPSSLDELAAILKAAQHGGARLQSIGNGTGPDRRRAMAGVVLIDMRRMNRVLEVNEQLAYALVEPGVTYQHLADHLKAHGQKLWVDNPGAPAQSVSGSFTERQAGYTPYADHHLLQCGLEVMLADGRVVRTGMGAMPKSTCWQLFKLGYGPWVDGLFTQSNYAVVTKVGLWMMPAPPAWRPFVVTVPREQDLEPLLDALRPLKIGMVIPNGVAVAHALHEAALMGKRRHDFPGQGPMAAGAVANAAQSLGIGYWNLYGAVYGIPANVEIVWQAVQGAFAAVPGARLTDLSGSPAHPLLRWRAAMMGGTVAAAPGTVSDWAGDDAIELQPMTAVDGADAMKLYGLSRDVMTQHGFDFVAETNAVWRAAYHRQSLCFGRPEQAAQARACAEALITAQAGAGFGQIGCDPSLSHAALSTYGQRLAALHQRVGTALAPNHVIARG
jgi:4-cresol dehydrogenase (hydroxylating)